MQADLEDEGCDQADKGQCLGESAEDQSVGEQLACDLGLASGADAQTIAAKTKADAWADGAKTVADNLESSENDSGFHFFLLVQSGPIPETLGIQGVSLKPLPIYPQAEYLTQL